jgi:hypothetical protein
MDPEKVWNRFNADLSDYARDRLKFDREPPVANLADGPGEGLEAVLRRFQTAHPRSAAPCPLALIQLCFASLVVTNLRRDFRPQECAHAGRTQAKSPAM